MEDERKGKRFVVYSSIMWDKLSCSTLKFDVQMSLCLNSDRLVSELISLSVNCCTVHFYKNLSIHFFPIRTFQVNFRTLLSGLDK